MSLREQQIRFCTSRDGTRIAYATCGAGPPLVWVGHWIGHLEFDWDHPVWRPWLSLLTRRHHLVRYDWRGCGLSDRENIEFSLEKHLEDLEAVVDAAGLTTFVLLGMSSEGAAATAYAVRHPEKVSHLVLYGAQVQGRLTRSTTPEQVAEVETRLKVIELGWPNENPAYGQFFTSLHIPDASHDQLRAFDELVRLATSPGNAIALLRAFHRYDLGTMAPEVRCSTLVLHPRQSSLIPFEEGRKVAALIPGARFVPLESRNHILLGDEPAWAQMAEALDEFLPELAVEATDGRIELVNSLTARERDILEVVAQGIGNGGIASRLNISEKTVRNHISTIFSKLEVNSRAQAIVLARDAGFGRRTMKT
jgi:pimeloyl-ACP methyl ester carboxylesterase/DNA-binding CsgD family transcriptional regulator